ncbi:MAG: hypothetical protein ACI83W_000670 [Marinoscillum sp.]|jgi:hypothetical protein
MIYASNEYASAQSYKNYKKFEYADFTVAFDLNEELAISLPFSPSGAMIYSHISKEQFLKAIQLLEAELLQLGIKVILITRPIDCYHPVPIDYFGEAGYKEEVSEISHFLDLQSSFDSQLHLMQKRKLDKLKECDFSKESIDRLQEVYDFIAECRQVQNIPLNISLSKLERLINLLPDNYDLHTARLNGELISACIMVRATDKVAYYFLPASSTKHKSSSSMVGLINHMYAHYQRLGFEYIDFGISSENGKPQKSLILFKERLGGIRSDRVTFVKKLD